MKKTEKKSITLANLTKIYNELPELAKKIPNIRQEFDMDVYGVYCGLKSTAVETECKTHGCGLGNSARLFDIQKSDFTYKEFSYDRFGKRILPYLYMEYGDDLWHFLFSSSWSDYQPTFAHFIKRVKYAIDMNLEIGEWKLRKTPFVK